MKTGPAILLLALAIAFQSLALPLYRAGSVAPDFPFLALVYLGFFAAPLDLFLLAVLAAVVIDLGSLDPLGTRLAGYLPALWFVSRWRRGFVAESTALRAGLTFAAAALAFTAEGALLAWKEGRWLGLGVELKAALYTALLGVAVHALLDRYRNGLGWARDRFFA